MAWRSGPPSGAVKTKSSRSASRSSRYAAENPDVDQARVVAVDGKGVGVGAAPAEKEAPEPPQRVEVLHLLEREDVGFRRLDGLGGKALLLVVEDVEVGTVGVPAVADRGRRIDVLVELEASKQVLAVERAD